MKNRFAYNLYQPKNIYKSSNHPEIQENRRRVYYRDRKNYYGPENTFEEIPKMDYKFKVNILIMNKFIDKCSNKKS